MEAFLVVNGHEINAPVADQEAVVLDVAAGLKTRDEFTDWLRNHVVVI